MATETDVICFECTLDDRDIKEWRKNGGELPVKRCQKDHRPRCKGCGNPTEPRKSGLCDVCWSKLLTEERAERKRKRAEKRKVVSTNANPKGKGRSARAH